MVSKTLIQTFAFLAHSLTFEGETAIIYKRGTRQFFSQHLISSTNCSYEMLVAELFQVAKQGCLGVPLLIATVQYKECVKNSPS